MSTLQGDLEQCSSLEWDPTPHEESVGWKEDLCHAISGNNWSGAKEILGRNRNALTAPIAKKGRTALHVAAMFGHVSIVEELLKLLDPRFLLTLDSDRFTALLLGCQYVGNTQVAKCLVEKNSELLVTPNKDDILPVTLALASDFIKTGRYLYFVTPLERLTDRQGSKLLHYCFHAQQFDIALRLLQRRQELLLEAFNDKGRTPIHEIATLNTATISPSELIFWKRWMYKYISIPSTTAINHVCLDIQREDKSEGDKAKPTEPGIQDLKLLRAQAKALRHLVRDNARKAYQKGVIDDVLPLAAKEGNAKFVVEVSKAIPEIFLSGTLSTCFQVAVENRQARVFELIRGLRFNHGLLTAKNKDGNTLIHIAAKMAPDHILNRIYAPTLQMQRELQWFKEVKDLTPRCVWRLRNNRGRTAEELFRASHKKLMKEGEKWIKETASHCSLVGALIVTIMFAVAFTVPGGNDQNLGYPLFIKQPLFKVFIFSTIPSLLSSSISILMFLAILTSQYSEEKFIESLPKKLILGLFFLFISIVTMMIAFVSTIYLMLKPENYSWGLLPIIIPAIVPIFLFVRSQFPLLLKTFVSTYGNIFDRKVKQWP